MVTDRSADILEAVVREFIGSGEPVSSAHLYRRYDFGIKPAMIRAELMSLTDEDFLEQPYHSSGRVPTNRGYEFFTSRVIERPCRVSAGPLPRLFHSGAWDDFLPAFSRRFGVLGVMGRGGEVRKDGLEWLVKSLDWDSRNSLMDVIRDFEMLDDRLMGIAPDFCREDSPMVFVGGKSPFTRSDNLSVVAGGYGSGRSRTFLLAIGPKRMNYEQILGLFSTLRQIGE